MCFRSGASLWVKAPWVRAQKGVQNRLHKPTTLAPAFQHFIEASPLEAQSALQQPHEVETLGSGARKMLVHGLGYMIVGI